MAGLGSRIDPTDSLARIKVPEDGDATSASQPAVAPDKQESSAPAIALFEARTPRFTFADIILPESTRREVDVLKSRIRNHSLLYEEWELKKIDPLGLAVAVNFYGQPGTGKSMCAEALASETTKSIIEVNYAEIESKYVGETPKNIRAAFKKAEESDAVLFFDEADSILGRRMTNVTQAADHGVHVSRAVMLKQLDAFSGIVVFATNLAKNFDGAFVRCILQHIEVPLPDEKGRLGIWQRRISPAVPSREFLDWSALALASEGLSGGEIKNAVIIALSELANQSIATRQLQMDNINRAIRDVKRAKKDIGRYDFREE